jgi:hypothetical protein
MGLNCPVDHLAGHGRPGDLDHRDLRTRGLVADGVHHVSRLQREQTGLVDRDARLGDAL